MFATGRSWRFEGCSDHVTATATRRASDLREFRRRANGEPEPSTKRAGNDHANSGVSHSSTSRVTVLATSVFLLASKMGRQPGLLLVSIARSPFLLPSGLFGLCLLALGMG
jgi:hypothetical protein